MKHIILSLFCFASLALAADEPLIPASLNALLPKITAGMKPEDIKAVVLKSYPKAERQDGPWSGQTGYLGFRLDDRFSFMVAGHMIGNGQEVVSQDARIYVLDRHHKRRLEIVPYRWEIDSETVPPTK
jgi:hypothetical protein